MGNKKAPVIRFKGYTEDWEQRKLGENVIIKSGWAPSNFIKTGSEESELFIKVNDLNYSSREQNDSQMRVHDNPRFQKMKKGSIIFPKRGAAIMTNKVRILGSDGYMDTNMMALEPQKIDGHFLYTFITRTGLYKIADTSTIPQINNKHIEPYIIYCPSIEEQTKVGAFFKKLDNTISLHQDAIQRQQDLKKALLQKLFPVNGERIPTVRFATFKEEWEQRKVRELFTVTRGQVLAATKTKDKETDEFIYPVYSSQTKNNGLMGFYNQYLFENAITWTTDGANAGTVNFRKGKFYSTNVNGVLLSDKGYANKAISEIINKIAWKHVSKVGNPKLMNNIMSEITIMIPSIEELNKISILFNQIDNTIALHQHKLEKLKNIKQAYLNELFV